MHCTKCGEKITSDAAFCKHCGSAQAKATVDSPAPEPAAAPAARSPRPRRQSRPSSREASKPNSVVWIVVAAVGLIALVYVVQQQSAEAPTNTASAVAPVATGGSPAPSDGRLISGTVVVPDGVTAPTIGTLYVMGRPAGAPQGPPIAAIRLQVAAGPMSFSMGPGDVMLDGVDFGQPLELSARWDQDGDPITKQVGDLFGKATTNPVTPGTSNVVISLGQVIDKNSGTPPNVPIGMADSAPAYAPAEGMDSAPAGEPASAPASAAANDGAPPSDKPITGNISIAPELAGAVPSKGVFYIIARPEGAVGGPPAAAKRIPATAKGTAYSISQADAMMGTMSGKMSLSVRWDQDGNAMTKEPGDLVGKAAKAVDLGESIDIVLIQKL